MSPLWNLLNTCPSFSAQQIHQMHFTKANALNLAKKTAKLKEVALLENLDIKQLPTRGKNLVQRLKEIKQKKQIYKEKRNHQLKRIALWQKLEAVAITAGIVLTVAHPLINRFLPEELQANSPQENLIPGVALLSQAAYSHYSNKQEKTETASEYHERKHGLDNERIAILVELESMMST